MKAIEDYIINKILEPLKHTIDFFDIWGKLEPFLEKIGLPMWIATIISGLLSFAAIAAIILLPGAIIAWIISKLRR